MKKIRNGAQVALVSAALVAAAGCGDLWGGGGGGGSNIRVTGNIDDIEPSDTGREVVVFVYRDKQEQADCEFPEIPTGNPTNNTQTLELDEADFDISTGDGRIVIAFLLDNAGNQADGRIDDGDPVAILNDPDCVLDDVPNRYVIDAQDILINFGTTAEPGFPAPGRAEAVSIEEDPND